MQSSVAWLRHIFLLAIAVITLTGFPARAVDARLNEALQELDIALRNTPETFDSVMNSLEGVKVRMKARSPMGDYEGIDSLIRGYLHRQVDSVNLYTTRGLLLARRHGDFDRELQYLSVRSRYLPLMGQTHEAILLLDSILALDLPADQKADIFYNVRAGYLIVTSIKAHSIDKSTDSEADQLLETYLARFLSANDSLLSVTSPSDPLYRLLTGTKYFGEGNYYLASAHLQEALEVLPQDSYGYLNAASMLAFLNYQRGRMDDWAYYITLVAIAEAKIANLDSECLRLLSSYLTTAGDPRRAESYAFISNENFTRSGAIIRNVHETSVFSNIIQSYRDSATRANLLLVGAVILLILSLMLVVGLMVMKANNIRSLHASQRRLQEANDLKEAYISHFLSLYGSFAERADEQQKLLLRKLTARQYDDLLSMLKSGRFREEQLAMFRESFDTGFLNLIPDFVERVNDLLEPDRRFRVPTDGKLTPELRILAFLRFGVTDNARIASFLNLTLNTVYTYRTRIRNRAINRDTFEADVQSIAR